MGGEAGWKGRKRGRKSGGEKLVYQRGLIMETRRKPLRTIFHDVDTGALALLFYLPHPPKPASNPTGTGATHASPRRESSPASIVSISVFS